MAFGYHADEYETQTLREVFGPQVREVRFVDAPSGRGRFASVEGRDGHGQVLATVTPAQRKVMAALKEVASMRAITVEFWLEVDAPDDDAPDDGADDDGADDDDDPYDADDDDDPYDQERDMGTARL